MNARASGSLLLLLLCAVAPLATASAQDDVLAVERREDLRGRDAVVRLAKAARGDFIFEGATPRDLCRLFATRLDDKVNFCVGALGELANVTATFELRAGSLWSAMALAEETTGLRFVYRMGVVFFVPKDAIKPLTYVVTYDLRAQTAKLRNFPGPDLHLPGAGEDAPLIPPETESDTTVSGFTAEGIEALLKENVTPELWGTDAASITVTNGVFVVRHSVAGHAQVRDLLVALGLIAPPRRIVVREAPPPPRPKTPSPSPSPSTPAPRPPARTPR